MLSCRVVLDVPFQLVVFVSGLLAEALAAPGGVPLWVSGVLPGGTHDLTAARELVLPGARAYLEKLPFLADSGYEGAGAGVHVPVKKPARGELDIDTKTRNALLRSLRYQGERGFALMSQRWRALQHVMVSPTTIGDLAKAAVVLVTRGPLPSVPNEETGGPHPFRRDHRAVAHEKGQPRQPGAGTAGQPRGAPGHAFGSAWSQVPRISG